MKNDQVMVRLGRGISAWEKTGARAAELEGDDRDMEKSCKKPVTPATILFCAV